MLKNVGVNLDSDVLVAVDAMAAKMKWSRSRTVNWILRQGVTESSKVVEGLKDCTLTDIMEMLAGLGVKKKLK